MEPARGGSCPSGERQGRAAHGEDKVPSQYNNFLPFIYNTDNPGTKSEIPRVANAPHGVETPTGLADC